MGFIKKTVCAECQSPEIVDINCRCVWDKQYPTIELEFEYCECCGSCDKFPADTEFNNQQLGLDEDIKEEEEDDE